MEKLVVVIFLVFSLVVLSGCTKDNWRAFYYVGGDYDRLVKSGELDSYEECVRWVDRQIQIHDDPNPDFECGRNCTLRSSDLYLCEETLD